MEGRRSGNDTVDLPADLLGAPSEQGARSAAEGVASFAFVVDRDARLLAVDRVLPNYSEEDVLGRSAYDYLEDASREAFRRAFDETKATGGRTTVELRPLDGEGRAARYEATLSPLREGHEIARVLVVAHDVGERRRIEREIRAAERRWNLLADSIPDVVAILDREARVLSINRSLPSGEALTGHTPYGYLTEESAAEYRGAFERVLATRTSARFESRRRGEDGAVGLWFETILVPLAATDDGDVTRVLAVARDVTERKRHEEVIRASEARWRTLLDSLPDIVLVMDRDRRILSANIPGSDAAIVGQLADAFLDEAMLEEFRGHVARALETERSVRYEIRSAATTGVTRWFDAVLVPLKTSDVIDRLMVVTRDITSQRAMLATLAEKERLASVGMVAASVAHEIMNPLTSVLANLEMALGSRGADAATSRQALVEAREGAMRMEQIVGDLRSLGRAGDEERLYVDVRNVVASALRLSGPDVGLRSKVTLDLAEVPGVQASESRLCQVFINLLVNAAQSMTTMPPAEREIRVRTRYEEAAAHVAIEVSDTGVGIPSVLHARVFEPFFTTRRAGTGLGLSISRDIVTRMGGRIDVASRPGEGTTFTVRLPAIRGHATPDDPR
jgi:two-component system, cell cycle sensor histidine kinase and response regulator CckA